MKFICKHCGHEITVDKKHAGKRADCPKCGSLITIPKNSSSTTVIYEDNSFFKSEKLSSLFADFLDKYEDKILQQRITKDGNKTLLELEVKTSLIRSQLIYLIYVEDTKEEWLLAYSPIGKITETEEFQNILIVNTEITSTPTYSLSVDDKFFTSLRISRRVHNIEEKVFYDMTIGLAIIADAIEECVFGVDEK